jgi:dipeptidyl aminopeptidase/acylaminoacyl peptidase
VCIENYGSLLDCKVLERPGQKMKRARCRGVFGGTALLCWLTVPPGCGAQQNIPLAPEDALRTRSFGELSPLAYSPDGKWVAFSAADAQAIQKTKAIDSYLRLGVPRRARGGQIWISNCESGETRNVTGDQGSNWMPAWSPDGRHLAFLSDRDGQARLWSWDVAKAELRRISSVVVRASAFSKGIQWLPDSQRILATTIPENLTVEQYIQKVAPSATAVTVGSASAESTVIVYGANSPGDGSAIAADNLNAEHLTGLALVDTATGKFAMIVAERKMGWFSCSPDGSRVAYSIPKRFEKLGSFARVFDLIVLDLASMQERTIASDILLDDLFSWSPDGAYVSYGTYGGDSQRYAFHVIDAVRGTVRLTAMLAHDLPCCRLRAPMWDSAGEHFYFLFDGALWRVSMSDGKAAEVARIRNRTIEYRIEESNGRLWAAGDGRSTVVVAHDDNGKQDGFYEIDLKTGQSKMLQERGECYTCKSRVTDGNSYLMTVSGDGRHVAYISEDAQHAPDLWVSDWAFSRPHRVTQLNPQFQKYKMGAPMLVDWRSDDGDRLHGALLLPSSYESGKKYPLVVWVYPALLSNWMDQFGFGEFPGPFNMQLLATRGYAVLLPDVKTRPGEPLMSLERSVLPGVNKVVEMGIADPDRLAVMGHSAGGYSTLGLLVQTNVFKVAMAAAGWADYAGLWGQMSQDGSAFHYGGVKRQLGGDPWESPLAYIQNSPIYALDKVQTPLLLIYGSEDEAASPSLLEGTFVGLQRLGKRTEYAKYLGEGHVPRDWSYANQTDLCKRVLDWLGGYLREPAN